jgi:hypothetical protein
MFELIPRYRSRRKPHDMMPKIANTPGINPSTRDHPVIYIRHEDRCVCCGEIIPEGRMVCARCAGELPN